MYQRIISCCLNFGFFMYTHTFSKSPPIIKFSRSLPFCGSGSHHNSSPLNQTKCGRDSVCSPFTPRHTSRLYFPTSLQFYTVVDKVILVCHFKTQLLNIFHTQYLTFLIFIQQINGDTGHGLSKKIQSACP